MKVKTIIFIIALLIGVSYTTYILSYDKGYYDAKQENYCNAYCTHWLYDNLYGKCYDACVSEKEYTNYWKYKGENKEEEE